MVCQYDAMLRLLEHRSETKTAKEVGHSTSSICCCYLHQSRLADGQLAITLPKPPNTSLLPSFLPPTDLFLTHVFQLSAVVASMDQHLNHRISFLEWSCYHYNKSWEELHTFADEAAYHRAQEAIRQARVAYEMAQAAIKAKKDREEADARAR